MVRYLGLIVTLFLTACAASPRYISEENFKGPSRAYEAKLPVGWVRTASDSDTLLMTRDGLVLQQISVAKLNLKNAFKKSEREAKEDMLPLELAELQTAELKSANAETQTLDVLELRPVKIKDVRAYMLRTRYHNKWGLEITRQTYGFIHQGDYFVIHYEAPALYYFEHYRPDFEKFVDGFKPMEKCWLLC